MGEEKGEVIRKTELHNSVGYREGRNDADRGKQEERENGGQ